MGRLYLTLQCHHRNDFCIKMGSAVNHFIASLFVRAQSKDGIHKPQLLTRKESRSRIELRSKCLPV